MSGNDGASVARRFLQALEARDLAAAERLLAPDPLITFPGGKVFSNLRQLVANAGGRYRWVKKNIDRIDRFVEGENEIVYVLGTLYGDNLQGVSFSDVRFVDRFVIRDGLILQQDVWNDLAESGVLTLREDTGSAQPHGVESS